MSRSIRLFRVLPLLLGVLLLHGVGLPALAHAAVTAPGHHPAAHPAAGPAAHAAHHGPTRAHGPTHPSTAVPHAPGRPGVERSADVREPCGHTERTEVGCAAAGVALAPAPPLPTSIAPLPVPVTVPIGARPCAPIGCRAPPSLSELQLLRI
ncbi:DUF6153 family protein [Streptomyces calidiresistens]|uniref:Uncharacterized protein n=1 Tax=Streptomyces calidiresistens TaxID=1485586 RepID=A0A7W3T4A3_9ACTN|nr:DUF6153 family protein [Streptomyces calidiresistens]MBB0230533.1 hypothetical protein [Streptomyces calidiresistens]